MDHSIILPSRIKVSSEDGAKGVYEIDGLYPGYGHTLGNSLRRILLSSLPGAAVTKVKIEGASHEFSTLSGILEDVVIIALNLKQLRFKLHGEGPETATIDVKGAREIKGKDIKCPTQLEVMNKDVHIATITEKGAEFRAELTVERGLGFVPSEELLKDKVPVGTLVLDAIFTPIRRANYEVENMRVGDRTDFNRLRLSIETDGTVPPREALNEAIGIMKAQIDHLAFGENEAEEKSGAAQEAPARANTSEFQQESGLEGLKISSRARNALLSAGIKTIQDLSKKSAMELLEIEGIGDKAVSEIKKALLKEGISLNEAS